MHPGKNRDFVAWITRCRVERLLLPFRIIWLNPWPIYTVLRLVVCSLLFSYIKQRKGGDLCAVSTHKPLPHQRASTAHRFTMKAPNPFRTDQSLISSPRHGYCDVFFCANFFWKALGSGQSGVRLGITMTTCCVLNMHAHHYNICSSHWLSAITGLSAFRKIYMFYSQIFI